MSSPILIIHQPEISYEKCLQVKDLDCFLHSYLEDYYLLREISLNKIKKTFSMPIIYSQSYLDNKASKTTMKIKHKDLPEVHFLGKKKNQSLTITDFFYNVLENYSNQTVDCFYIFYGWYPFLDDQLCTEMQKSHDRFGAHITYGENLPNGFAPDLINHDYLKTLHDEKIQDIRSFTFANMDRFDVEIYYKRPELRHYRLDFSTINHRSTVIAKNIINVRYPLQYNNLQNLLQKQPLLFRIYPSYFSIELTNKNELQPFYLPAQKRKSTELNETLLEKLYQDIHLHALLEDTTLSFSGLGEPTEHHNYLHWLEKFSQLPQVKRIYLETFGYQLNDDILIKINNFDQAHKIEIILLLSTLKAERYTEFYNTTSKYFNDIMEVIKKCTDFFNQPTCRMGKIYCEMIRMQENIDEVDAFIKFFHYNLITEDYHLNPHWQSNIAQEVKSRKLPQSTITPILTKPNHFLGRVKDRKVSDFSPVLRSFCWHLQRDLVITCEGKIPVCKQDPEATASLVQNFAKYTVSEIQDKQQSVYLIDQCGDYKKNKINCAKCDEWYTFNA